MVLLGMLTVGAYGLVIYSFGVIIGPVHKATGWSIGALSISFTLSSLIGGFAGPLSGWALDRFGARMVLLSGLAVGTAFLFLASTAQSAWVFVLAWGMGGGAVSAGLFYGVTMALTTRLFPADRVRAFAILTFIGGFAAVIYFPVAGILVDLLPWRAALRLLIVLMVALVLPAALLVKGGAASDRVEGPLAGMRPALGAFVSADVLQMIAMFSLASMAFAAIQVHHVPAMTSAGASLGLATGIASARGFLSLPGRVLMEPVVRRLGVPQATGVAYGVMALGTLPLLAGGSLVWLGVFMVATGLVFGAISPLHGLFAAEVFGEHRIGTMMGLQGLVVSLVSAVGPTILGLTVDATGGYEVAVVMTSCLFGGALGMLLLGRSRWSTANTTS